MLACRHPPQPAEAAPVLPQLRRRPPPLCRPAQAGPARPSQDPADRAHTPTETASIRAWPPNPAGLSLAPDPPKRTPHAPIRTATGPQTSAHLTIADSNASTRAAIKTPIASQQQAWDLLGSSRARCGWSGNTDPRSPRPPRSAAGSGGGPKRGSTSGQRFAGPWGIPASTTLACPHRLVQYECSCMGGFSASLAGRPGWHDRFRGWGSVSQAAVRTHGVVVAAPGFDENPGLLQGFQPDMVNSAFMRLGCRQDKVERQGKTRQGRARRGPAPGALRVASVLALAPSPRQGRARAALGRRHRLQPIHRRRTQRSKADPHGSRRSSWVTMYGPS